MGVYDSVFFKCPKCGEDIEEQSKAGACLCRNIEPEEVPFEIAVDLVNTECKCYSCGSSFQIISLDKIELPKTFRLKLVLLKDNSNQGEGAGNTNN